MHFKWQTSKSHTTYIISTTIPIITTVIDIVTYHSWENKYLGRVRLKLVKYLQVSYWQVINSPFCLRGTWFLTGNQFQWLPTNECFITKGRRFDMLKQTLITYIEITLWININKNQISTINYLNCINLITSYCCSNNNSCKACIFTGFALQ